MEIKKFFLCLCILSFYKPSFPQTWSKLNDSIIYYFNSGKYLNGVEVGEKALSAAKSEFGENHSSYATTLNNLAIVYEKIGNYKRAESLYTEALVLRKKILGESAPSYATSLKDLAGFALSQNMIEKAETLFIELVTVRKKYLGENHPDYAASLNALGFLYKEIGLYEKAEPLYLEALAIRKNVQGENHPDYIISLNNMASLWEAMGYYEKAEPIFLKVIAKRKILYGENHTLFANSLNNLAHLYGGLGQYEKAEQIYIRVSDIRKKMQGEAHLSYSTSLANLASLYQIMNQYEKAEQLFIKVLEIDKKLVGENDNIYASNLSDLANLYRIMGQYEKAEVWYSKSLTIQKALGETNSDYISSLCNLAGLYTIMGYFEKAELLYDEALVLYKKMFGNVYFDNKTILYNLAVFYETIGHYEKAEELFKEAININKKNLGDTHSDYAASLISLATLYIGIGQYEMAEPLTLEYFKIVIQNLQNNFSFLSENEKQIFIEKNFKQPAASNSLLYANAKISPAIIKEIADLQLFFNGLILDNTKHLLATLFQSRDTALKKMFKEWQLHKKILSKQYSLTIEKRRTNLKDLEEKKEQLEKELNSRSFEFKKQQFNTRIRTRDVQKMLNQDEVAIEFVRFQFYNKKLTDSIIYAAYILSKNNSVPKFVPLFEEKQLQQLLDSVGKSATTTAKVFYRGLELKNKNTVQGRQLYKLIWQPLEPYLKNVKKISYSPAGKLYGIAFHALAVDSISLLMEKYQLQQYTSTRQVALRTVEDQIKKPSSIVLFGDASFTLDSLQIVKGKTKTENVSTSIYTPQNRETRGGPWDSLPWTAQEISTIKKVFEQNKIAPKTFTQTTASEENLKALSGNSPQILHIATHGFFLPEPTKRKKESGFDQGNAYTLADDPLLRSGLILAGGNYAWSGKTPIDGVEDGIATAYEISQLNLSNTELVVLSACETALGDVKGSEGVFGLQRAFKMAGVKKMIVSLWQVPDKETAELMTAFYTYWMKGKTIDDAFKLAQTDMRKKYSPFFWAAFVLVE